MTFAIWAAAAFCGTTTLIHIVSVFVAITRCRPRPDSLPAREMPPVTIIRPVCGIDNFIEDTLRSSFELPYPEYEIIFCVAQPRDPVTAVVRALIATYPARRARLLVGDERVSANPKLNNCVKGWNAAAHEWIVIADSNVMMPRDYIQRLLAAWRPDSGLVCSPPIGSRPGNFLGELQCVFLHRFPAPRQYFPDPLAHRV